VCCFDNEKCHGGHPNNCHASPPSVAGCSPFLFAPFFFGFFHLFSTLAHRSGRVIGTDTLRVFLVSQVSSHGEKHEQESEDNRTIQMLMRISARAASRCVGSVRHASEFAAAVVVARQSAATLQS